MKSISKIFRKLKSKKTEKEVQDETLETDKQYDNKGEYIVLAGYKANGKGELTIETNLVVTKVTYFRDGWLQGEFNGKVGIFPEDCVKKREAEHQQGKYSVKIHPKRKHKYTVPDEKNPQINTDARQSGKGTYDSNKSVDNEKAVHAGSLQEELLVEDQAELSPKHLKIEDGYQDRQCIAQVHTTKKYISQEEKKTTTGIDASQSEECTYKSDTIDGNAIAIHDSRLIKKHPVKDKAGHSPDDLEKKKEDEHQERQCLAQIHTTEIYINQEEKRNSNGTEARQSEEGTYESEKIDGNAIVVHDSRLTETLLVKDKEGQSPDDLEKEKKTSPEISCPSQNDKSSTEQDFRVSGSSLDDKDIDKNQLHSNGNGKEGVQDYLSAEQVKAPVEKIEKNTDGKLKNSLEFDEEFPDLKRFIKFLGLEEYFPDKMQVRHVMTIELSVKPLTLKKIALMFVRNMIMTNLNGRDRLVQENLRQKYQIDTGFSLNDNFLESLLRNNDTASHSEINPLDLTIAVFKCSSPMLKHTLASKFFTCQLAVPFAFPKYFDEDISISSIPLHSVVIECTSNGKTINEVPLDCPCHVVSFVRFGRLSVSKSKLMNEILNDQYHNTFFDKDCPLGSSNRCISEGLIEAAWYLPPKKSNFLNHVTTFLNLRGDANRYQEQLKICSTISSILVILVDMNSLDENITQRSLVSFLENVRGIILAIDAKQNTKKEFVEKWKAFCLCMKTYQEKIRCCILQMKEEIRSSADVKKEMRESIKMMLVDETSLSSISQRLKSSNLETKKDIGCYQDVQQHVENLWKFFPKKPANVKQQVIPVQGEHWKAWSKKLKTYQNSSFYKSSEEAGTIKKQMIDERMKQVELCRKIDPFMETFIDYLWNLSESENKCHVFVMLVKKLLDDRSRTVLPEFKLRYLSDWSSLKIAKEQQKEQTEINDLLAKVEESEKELSEASFGFEHLCRELGQIFEALSEYATELPNLHEYRVILPKIAARLLLMGQPFELMDGDVANVPMEWVKAVFRELKKSLGDKIILGLSVLGIQSSGKSTLLNTMFGFQFAVSAGRCTRGVYAQLMPVKNGHFPFEYILVIDTEGLRALELADLKKSHDNELATFVVGLGDITIVNVKGENTTEVKDVLQIVVHAFLRLNLANKKSNLKQRCIFAHQNVPAQDANEKMRHGRQKFIEKLDQMTKEAAAQEKIVDIQTFNEVIQLDIENDIWYFSDLWRGDPPMAPANPGYSDTVADALKAITERLIVDRETYLTITDTVARIDDLWSGILKDDFVFSFRNCLEFKAYNDMERHYHSLTWGLEKKVQEFIKADAKSIFITCDNPNDLDNQISKIFLKLSRLVNDDLQKGTKEMNSFIENNGLKDIMIQWQQSKQNKFKCFVAELIAQAKLDIINFKEELKVQKKRLTVITLHEHEINQQAEQIAVKMKRSFANDHIIEQTFNKMWNGWISQLDTKAIKHGSSIKEQIELLIHNRFPADVTYLKEVDQSNILSDISYHTLKQLEDTLPLNYITKEYYSIHSQFLGLKNKITKVECKVQIIQVVNVVFRKIDSRLSELQIQDTKFNNTFVSEILNMICDAFDDHNEHKNNKYHFNLTNAFRACVCSHVKRYLVFFFATLDENYNGKHSPKAVMEEYKGTVWKLFTNTVESKTEDAIAVDLLRDVIIKEMVRNISGMMSIDVQSYILGMYPFRKIRLIKDILTNLAEKEDFSAIKSYIQDPLVFSTKWINDITNKTIFEIIENGCTVYAKFARTRITNVFPKIAKAISDASEACRMKNHENVSQWIDNFVKNMNQHKIPISNDTMVHVKSRNISNLDSFVEILKQQLDDIKYKITTIFENTRKDTVLWDENPVPKIMQKLWGCLEVCMFCNEPCINTDKDHVDLGHAHECLQHRPQGIGGFNWERSNKLCVEFCNHWVGTEQTYVWYIDENYAERRKYREYKKHFPDWDIPHSLDKCQFWMWIICKYKPQLSKMYCTDLPDIPESWPLITKAQAIESLSVYMVN